MSWLAYLWNVNLSRVRPARAKHVNRVDEGIGATFDGVSWALGEGLAEVKEFLGL